MPSYCDQVDDPTDDNSMTVGLTVDPLLPRAASRVNFSPTEIVEFSNTSPTTTEVTIVAEPLRGDNMVRSGTVSEGETISLDLGGMTLIKKATVDTVGSFDNPGWDKAKLCIVTGIPASLSRLRSTKDVVTVDDMRNF